MNHRQWKKNYKKQYGYNPPAYMDKRKRRKARAQQSLCQDCHNKEHHAKNVRAKRYAFTADGELIPPIQKNIFHSR